MKSGKVKPPLEETASRLTSREREVLSLVVSGITNHEIARELKIGLETVRTHVSHLLRKMGLQSRKKLISCVLGQV